MVGLTTMVGLVVAGLKVNGVLIVVDVVGDVSVPVPSFVSPDDVPEPDDEVELVVLLLALELFLIEVLALFFRLKLEPVKA